MKILVMEGDAKGTLPPEEEEIRQARVRSYASPGTEIVFGYPEAADFWRGPHNVENQQRNAALFKESLVKTAIQAEKDGFDAIVAVWGMAGGVGQEEARHYVRIPVIDFSKIAPLLSQLVGNKLGRLYYTNQLLAQQKESMKAQGLDRFVVSWGSPDMHPTEMRKRPDELRRRFIQAAKKCVAEGAEVILAGHSIIPGTLDADEMTREVGVPVLNGVKLGIRMAEFIVQNRLIHSEKAYPRKVYPADFKP